MNTGDERREIQKIKITSELQKADAYHAKKSAEKVEESSPETSFEFGGSAKQDNSTGSDFPSTGAKGRHYLDVHNRQSQQIKFWIVKKSHFQPPAT